MRKVILDVDTGTDDAIAVMAALQAHELDVVALCSVHGNIGVEYTTVNTLRAAYAAGAETVPVYPGCEFPLVKDLYVQRKALVVEPILSGKTIIEGKEISVNPNLLPLPDRPKGAEKKKAPFFYVDYLRNTKEKVTLVLTGTMTNLAIALTMDPQIAEAIEEIVIMGGGIRKRNITAASEANFFKDPESAAIVLGCGAPVTICTLDATHSSSQTAAHEEKIRKVGTKAAVFTANDIHVRRESYNRFQPLERKDTAPIHDALCIAYLVNPNVIVYWEMAHCDVDCSDGICEGALLWDTRYFHGKENVKLALEASSDLLCDTLTKIFQRGEDNGQ